MPSDSDDIRRNPSAKHHHILPPDTEPTTASRADMEAANKLAKALIGHELASAKDIEEQSRRLWKSEPEHPLVAACDAWNKAIHAHDPIQASLEARRVVNLMEMYQHRPAFSQLFNKLHMNDLLAPENVDVLQKLAEVARG